MQNTRYYVSFILFTCLPMMGMELTIPTKPAMHLYNKILTAQSGSIKSQQCYTFVTNEIPAQHITIPLELAMQCKSIKTMVEDWGSTALQESPLAVPINAPAEIVLEFIAYLKKIDRIGKIADNQLLEWKIQNFIFSQHLQTFDTTELIDLALIVDLFDTTNNYHLIEELARRMHPPIKKCFNRLDNKAILRSVIQKICKDDQYDTKLIQPYVNTLNQCYAVPRTESLIQNFKNNMYNAFPWHSQILFMPHYINLQTGTIIKSEEHMDASHNPFSTNKLYIYQKNNPPVIIPFNNIKCITHIEANNDESLFICKCQDSVHQPDEQYYIIDPSNPDKQPPCYDLCTFTENNKELYAVTGNNFGIFHAKTDTFTSINADNIDKIQHFSTNKNKKTIALSTGDTILIGKKNEKNDIIFHQFSSESIENIDTFYWNTGITNICLHPHENKIYLGSMGLSCIVNLDLDTLNGMLFNKPIPFMTREAHEIRFISNDILFIGYETGKDYFVNIRTGNHWTKDKPSGFRRLALTTDNMHSIEEVTKSIDGTTTTTTEIRQIIDDTIINTVHYLNQGYYPLTLLDIAQQKQDIVTLPDDGSINYQNLNENFKTILNTTHTIANTTLLSQVMAPFRSIWPTVSYYGKSGAIFAASMVGTAIFTSLIKRISKNKLNDNNVSSLLNGILWLARLALG